MHSYRIANPTTVVQERMNRLLMIEADSVHVKKDYSARLPELYGWDDGYWGSRSVPRRGTAQLAFSFFNKDKEGLGQSAARCLLPQAAHGCTVAAGCRSHGLMPVGSLAESWR